MLPRLVITCGEPAGIGPELCLKLAALPFAAHIAVCADPALLEEQAARMGLPVTLDILADPLSPPLQQSGRLAVWPHALAVPSQPAKPDPRNAAHVLAMLDSAVTACRDGHYDAMITAPVQKSVVREAGFDFCGHTEYLAQRLGAGTPLMLLVSGALRVALATTHLPLRAVPDAIDFASLDRTLITLHHGLQRHWRIAQPRILVCGLNPHAGEGGHLGLEDRDVILPAILAAQRRGIRAHGPVPADTAFTPDSLQGTDAVLAMYHDQGLPVLKSAGFGNAVNITLGLPIVRTSVDHGTALDIAGRGIASASSLRAAVELALQLAAPGHS